MRKCTNFPHLALKTMTSKKQKKNPLKWQINRRAIHMQSFIVNPSPDQKLKRESRICLPPHPTLSVVFRRPQKPSRNRVKVLCGRLLVRCQDLSEAHLVTRSGIVHIYSSCYWKCILLKVPNFLMQYCYPRYIFSILPFKSEKELV